ncbi:OstA-like protein [Blattabacterium cuenoti]|uniref:OstA-like protein n=1 Tax=Blattabacterium cuenoti TaxID=1653831 RepID=UPI001EEC3989|nr:LptA/OstA family protein [Blattabacterium cuenoti]
MNKIFSNEVKKNIQIIHADLIQNDVQNQSFILIGNVHLKYGRHHLFCDKIVYQKKNNKYHGYGNVRLESGKNKIISQNIVGNFVYFKLSGKVILYQGKIRLTGDVIDFNLKKKFFQVKDNVILFFGKIKLKTNLLEYDLILNKIFYKKRSILYYGDDCTISSKEGYFYVDGKKVELKYNVQLNSENYTIHTNILEYLFVQNKVNFHNPAIIIQNTNSNNFIYAKKAVFLVHKKIFLFKSYVSIHYNGVIIRGEYLFFNYEKKSGFIKNILLEDTIRKCFLTSGYGEFDFYSGSLTLKENPKIIKISKNNSVFIYSDILKIKIKKNNTYSIQAFSVKSFFLNEKIQGKCDFFNYEPSNNYMHFDGNPIFWIQNQQITGKVIYIYLRNENSNLLKYIKIVKNAFYIEKINSKEFNQIEGDIIIGFFNKENSLEKVKIQGDVNSIVFIDADKGKKIINRLSCKILLIYLDNSKKIRKISCEKEAYSELIPVYKDISNNILYLSKFSWKEKDKLDKNKKNLLYKEIDKYKKESLLEKKQIEIMVKKQIE